METIIANLNQAAQTGTETTIDFGYEVPFEIQKEINTKFQAMSDEEKIAFIVHLHDKRHEKGLEEEIGQEMATLVDHKRVIFTITSDDRQLRCWHGAPGWISPDGKYFDSCGKGLYFSVVGDNLSARGFTKWILKQYEGLAHWTKAVYFIPVDYRP